MAEERAQTSVTEMGAATVVDEVPAESEPEHAARPSYNTETTVTRRAMTERRLLEVLK
jgi:hypothetical protein